MKFIIYKNIKDKKLRQDMLEILKILTLESVKFKKGVDKENLNKILTILNNSKFNKEWKRNIIKIIKELQDLSTYENKFLVDLKKLFFSYSETKEESNLNFIFELYLKTARFSNLFNALHLRLSISGFDQEWADLCHILGVDRFLRYYIDYNKGNLISNDNEIINNYYKDTYKPQSKYISRNINRGAIIEGSVEVFNEKGIKRYANLNWIVRYYHIYLKYEGSSFNVKMMHWILSSPRKFSNLINSITIEIPAELKDPEIIKIWRIIIKNTYKSSDIINNNLIKNAKPIQTNNKNKNTDFNLFIIELENYKVISVLSHKDSKFKKVLFKYPIKN